MTDLAGTTEAVIDALGADMVDPVTAAAVFAYAVRYDGLGVLWFLDDPIEDGVDAGWG